MKLKCDMWRVTSDGKNNTPRAAHSCHPSPVTRHPPGVALIITLILLAVVTFMALTFLAVSRRERGAVTTTTDTATARLAADDALASAEAQVVANILATTNPYNFSLLVSTNYINPLGFTPGSASPTNVNYDYLIKASGGGPLGQAQFLQNLANLYYNPRPPVFITTSNVTDFRFYLDLNHNGRFETNGLVGDIDNNNNFIGNVSEVGDPEWIGVLQHPDQPHGPNNPFVARFAFIAMPIGNALDLNAIHNQVLDEYAEASLANKRGVSVIQPPFGPIPGGQGDGFMRNQGVGSWEINLAAFLADLNTNQFEWGFAVGSGASASGASAAYYQYNRANPFTPNTPGPFNKGNAFDDARALLSYRYQNNYLSLKSAGLLFLNLPPNFVAGNTVPFDNIDGYSDGPLQITPVPIDEVGFAASRDNPAFSWSGADNTNHFFDLQELLDTNKTEAGVLALPGFTDRMLTAGAGGSTYNRYTYYRLLSQLDLESTPESGKLNVNYQNVDANGSVVPNMATNFIPWTDPLQFFTNAADRMLRDYSQQWLVESPSNYVATFNMTANIGTAAFPTNMPVPFGISDIPVLVSNRFVYTPAVQRVLQVAANIYDATTNNTFALGANFPSVFRPTFNVVVDPPPPALPLYTNVYINGYESVVLDPVNPLTDPQLNLPVNVTDLPNLNPIPSGSITYTNVNVYGVPWIVGAKKDWPNFNEFAMESVFQLTRKLQVTRTSTNQTIAPVSSYSYNQMFNLSITNQFGVECWNSYTNNFIRSVAMYVTCTNTCVFTNDENFSTIQGSLISGSLQISNASYNNNGWPGYNPDGSGAPVLLTPASFQIPLDAVVTIITNSMYRFNGTAPFLTTNLALPYESNVVVGGSSFPQPHWWLMTTNNIRVIVLDNTDPANQRIIDYVQLSGPNSTRDLTSEIISQYDTATGPSGSDQWNTNVQNGIPPGPIGLISQVGVSFGSYTPGLGSDAWNNTDVTTRHNEIDGFRAFYGYGPLYNDVGAQQVVTEAGMTNAIQAPYTPTATVVQHYSWQANDPLVHYTASDLNWAGASQLNQTADDLTNEDLGKLNQRYMPCGGNPVLSGADPNPYNLALKDPLVWRSDDWDFPTYKMPNIGWLGRVHRGTPWQTVYLKSPDILQEIQINGGSTNDMGTNTWVTWTGNALLASGQSYDAANMAPMQDRLLFDIFTTAFNDNATRGQLPVNVDAGNPSPQAGLSAWSALFSGVLVLSNNAVDGAISTNVIHQHNGSLPNFTTFPINPAGPGGAGSAIGQIVQGINQTRANAGGPIKIVAINGTVTNEIPINFVNADGLAGSFEHVGDILSVPQLTDQSPFLNWFDNGDPMQQINGISDEMYEWLPQQVMSLLRVSDSPRYVIYCYGQALKPAQNGIYTGSGAYFSMITNYQIVAESATRTVVRFNGKRVNILTNDVVNTNWIVVPSVTNNNAVIERFNVLPPD